MTAAGRPATRHAASGDGGMRALNRHVERVFNPDREDPQWGRRRLARDR
jgi:hypothetical protein